jgi:hypothetical protein
MNYKKIYDSLVGKCKVRGLDKSKHGGYFELHHIVPKCMGGSDEKNNLVMFTGREHFIAHMLLWKAYPESVSLMRAAFMMSSRWKSGSIKSAPPQNSRTYARLREEYAQAVREQWADGKNPMYGKTHTEEARNKLKAWYAANPDHHTQVMANKRGITLEEAYKIKREKQERVELFHYNKENGIKRELTATQRQALLIANTGRVVTQETKDNFSRAFKALEKQPWDTYNVRTDGEILLRWVYADLIKTIWVINGSLGHKFFTSIYNELLGAVLPCGSLKSMVSKFQSGWEPTKDSKWINFHITALKDEDYKEELLCNTEDSLEDIKSLYLTDWLDSRDMNRDVIANILSALGIKSHKNNSKSSLTMLDVTEANILYQSGTVSKKTIAELFGVKANTVSQFTSPGLRFKDVTSCIDTICEMFYEEVA